MPRRTAQTASGEEVLAWLRQEHEPQFEMTVWTRGVLLAAEPDLAERIYRGWDGIGFHHPDAGYVCALFPRADGLLLWFEHGGALEDPARALVGDGTRGRSLPIHGTDTGTARRIRVLLERAVAHALAT
jgi:hypothetical protein